MASAGGYRTVWFTQKQAISHSAAGIVLYPRAHLAVATSVTVDESAACTADVWRPEYHRSGGGQVLHIYGNQAFEG